MNAWRKNTLGLPAIYYNTISEKSPFLYGYSEHVVPQPAGWPAWIHTCGYWFLDFSEHNWAPPDDLVKFIEQGPTIYIGFGSVVVDDPAGMTRAIVEAVEKAGVRVILSKVF